MIKTNFLLSFLFLCSSLGESTKIEQVFDTVEKINDLGSSVPGFGRVSQFVSQGLDIAKDLVTIFKKVPDPDESLTLREKYFKDKTVLERYIEKYGNIQGVQGLNIKDFKLHYDEIKNIFQRYGKNQATLSSEWASYRDNEASYIAFTALKILEDVRERIAEIDNKEDLLAFEGLLVGVSNRLYAKQTSLSRIVAVLDQSEKNILDVNEDEQYLFDEVLKKDRAALDSSLLYNTYNTLLDSLSFVENKNKLYITLKKKLGILTENIIDLQIKNNMLTEKYLNQLQNVKNKEDPKKINLLAATQKFETKKRVTNPQVAIPGYGWGRAIFDKDFRTKEVIENKVKDKLFRMNKYIVFSK